MKTTDSKPESRSAYTPPRARRCGFCKSSEGSITCYAYGVVENLGGERENAYAHPSCLRVAQRAKPKDEVEAYSENLQRETECGCIVFGAAQFCKMHAAAPALVEALEAIAVDANYLESSVLPGGPADKIARKIGSQARAALAAARKGE